MNSKNKGICALEMFFVITVILILLAILLPAFTRAYRSDKLSNKLLEEYNLSRTFSGIWYNMETKEVVILNKKNTEIIATNGIISCEIGKFLNMSYDEQIKNIDWTYKSKDKGEI